MLKYAFKRKVKIFLAVLFLPVLLIGLARPQTVLGSAYDYDTNSFRTDVDVKSDNSFTITETIDVDFHTEKHGLYRYIPLEGAAYYKVNGEKVEQSRKMKIDQVKVDGYEYETYQENGNYVIKVGDEDKTVSGKQRYTISYRCRLYDDKINAYDIFYYNVLPQGSGAGWETAIEKAYVRIKMPKSFDSKSLNVYAGSYGSNAFSDRLSVKVSDKVITIRSNERLPQGVGITVQEILPEGYFTNEMTTDWAYSLILITAILSGLLAFVLWLTFGRDPKLVRTVEFYPPDGLTSADIGYIIDGYVDKKDMISMIIYFAHKGYLSIEEKERGKFWLHKQKELPDKADKFERTLMKGLFACGDGNSVELSQLKEEFYKSYLTASKQLKNKYKAKKHRLFYKSGNIARVAAAILMIVPVCAGIVFSAIFKQEEALAIAAVPLSLILFLLYLAGMVVYDKKGSMRKGKFLAWNIVIFLLSLVILFMTFGLITFLAGTAAGVLSTVSSAAAYVCARQMRKRTAYGNEMTGKILGFRHFIQTAELSRLEMLVDENPAYFYHVLPYAYVFGLSDKWSKTFESIAVEPPSWYGGHYGSSVFNTWVFMNAFHSCTYAMQQNIQIPSASESGGSGYSGSFSGGGFSGGGFGGGGGGSW